MAHIVTEEDASVRPSRVYLDKNGLEYDIVTKQNIRLPTRNTVCGRYIYAFNISDEHPLYRNPQRYHISSQRLLVDINTYTTYHKTIFDYTAKYSVVINDTIKTNLMNLLPTDLLILVLYYVLTTSYQDINIIYYLRLRYTCKRFRDILDSDHEKIISCRLAITKQITSCCKVIHNEFTRNDPFLKLPKINSLYHILRSNNAERIKFGSVAMIKTMLIPNPNSFCLSVFKDVLPPKFKILLLNYLKDIKDLQLLLILSDFLISLFIGKTIEVGEHDICIINLLYINEKYLNKEITIIKMVNHQLVRENTMLKNILGKESLIIKDSKDITIITDKYFK